MLPETLLSLGTLLSGWAVAAAWVRRERIQRRAVEKCLAAERDRAAAAETMAAGAETMAVVGRLASGVAHEINNPLSFVKANLVCLTEELDPRGRTLPLRELELLCRETLGGVERIQQIVADLKLHAHASAPTDEPCSIPDVITEALRIASVRLRSRVAVTRQVAAGLPRALGNRRHLMQVLVNLLMNAADAMDELPSGRAPELRVRATLEQGQVLIRVEDNGPGFSAKVQARLFEPFFTTKPVGKGTGLGLALSRDYLKRCGGELHASTRPEGGACMTIVLPGEAERPLGLQNDERPEETVRERRSRVLESRAA